MPALDLMGRITRLRDAADVKRYHTKRTQREQTNGQHSFNMLTLVLHIWPESRKELMQAIIHHDLPELDTGDTPGPFKREYPHIAGVLAAAETKTGVLFYNTFELTEEERDVLKWADRMEAVLWNLEEYVLGNRYAEDTVRATVGWVLDNRIPTGAHSMVAQMLGTVRGLGMYDETPKKGQEA